MKKTYIYLLAALTLLVIPTGVILAQAMSAPIIATEPTPLPLPPSTQPTPIPEINSYGNNVSFTFANLDEDEIILHYPSQKNLYANFPNQWNLVPGSGDPVHFPAGAVETLATSPFLGTTFLELHYDFSETLPDRDTAEAFNLDDPLGNPFFWSERPSMEILINGVLVASFVPKVGDDLRVQIPINYSPAFNNLENPFNEFEIHLGYYNDGDIFCNYDGLINIHKDSTINTTYYWFEPYRTITDLPRPLVQDSFIPEILKIIVSDNPTVAELEAITNITASISRNSFSNVSYEVLHASEATEEALSNYNAVIIGSPANNAYLKGLYTQNLLPSILASDGKDISAPGRDITADTGVLQIIPSPINQLRTFVTITGESDLAIVRASNAFATPPIGAVYQLLTVDTDYAKPMAETTVNEETGIEAARGLYKLTDLGYRQRTLYGAGQQLFFVTFYVGRDWVLEDDLTFKVNYSHADTFDFNSSNAAVLLNGEPIGNLLISPQPKEMMTQEIIIKKENIVKGTVNLLQISANLNITIICEEYDPSVYWFTLFDSSELTIPHSISSAALDVTPIFHPTMPFAYETSHLVLTSADPRASELSALANFYGQLSGLNANGFYDVTINMGDAPDLAKYPDHNIIMFGLPSDTNFVDSINDSLPQPFMPGTNNLQQVIGQSAYQLVPGIQIGVVQAIQSPNNPARMITLFTGTSEEGFRWSMKQMEYDLNAFVGDLFFAEENKLTGFATSQFSQAVIDSLVSETLQEEEFVPIEEEANPESGEQGAAITSDETYIRPEEINNTTKPFLMIAGIAAVGVLSLIAIGTSIANGKRRRN